MSTNPLFNQDQPFLVKLISSTKLRFNLLLDKLAPHTALRWVIFLGVLLLYCLRVYLVQGFYIITYGLGIYLLNLFIGFLQPQDDLETVGELPKNNSDDSDGWKPFRRRVPEFKFWWSATKAIIIGFFMTFFSIFDIPVFWPILLLYFIVLFTITMKRQIKHMIKYKYIPFSLGKPKYKEQKITKKDKPDQPMPRVRPPLRFMPHTQHTNTSTLKKVNKD